MSTRFSLRASGLVLCVVSAFGFRPAPGLAANPDAVVGCPAAPQRVRLLGTCLTGPIAGALPSPCEQVDLNRDTRVDLRDAAAFWDNYGEALANDACACPLFVADGWTLFTNLTATDDGPSEPGICNLFGDPRIQADVWFCYEATCNGEAVVSLCGAQYDTKLAVYQGCGCPTAPPLACSDDDCAPGTVTSRVVFQAQAGIRYMIRIGGYQAAQGVGQLAVRCGTDPCASAEGECFVGHITPGCNEPTCCGTACNLDPFCCDVVWDSFCAGEAEGLCTGSFPACAPGAGACGTDHGGTPGCDDVACCNTVCMNDPYCCIVDWDAGCATQAGGLCGLTCGPGSGSCFIPHGIPGCDDVACCELICDVDGFCCETEWDSNCVDLAAGFCR